MSDLLASLRKFAQRAGFPARYVWVLELTKRNRPHYHVLVWLPKGRTLPKPDKRGWWPHGMTRIEWARNAIGYVAKYASKLDAVQAQHIPRGARMCGLGGASRAARVEVRWWKLPLWVREFWPTICDTVKTLGGYARRDTGEWLRSPWKVSIDAAGRVFAYKEPMPCAL
ncbi:MAG: hypothetical protein JNK21_03495 [Rhodospirillaceae bacterium]|nr:hypothetical protein [Rhodospirillaceae bacterium]